MHCEGCAHIIQNALERLDGVQTSSVSHKDGTARVLYDPGHIDSARIVAAVEKAGHGAAEA
jgi:Cu+-exporting ATPase